MRSIHIFPYQHIQSNGTDIQATADDATAVQLCGHWTMNMNTDRHNVLFRCLPSMRECVHVPENIERESHFAMQTSTQCD